MKNRFGNWRISAEEIERSWETIGISNDFLFGKLMRNEPELCRKLVQRILPDLQIDHIEILETQKSIDEDIDARSVRLDVYLMDRERRVYSVEMQMVDTRELPKRSRYYSAMIDLQLLDKGINYRNLNDTYIIFICPFDLYGAGRHIYTFDGRCREDPKIRISDGATRIFLNAAGTADDAGAELQAFLDYVLGKPCADSYVQELEAAVRKARKNRKWRHEYMTLLLRDQENIEKGMEIGREEGRKEAREKGIRLMISALKDFGIPEEEIIKKVQEKYRISGKELKRYLGEEAG